MLNQLKIIISSPQFIDNEFSTIDSLIDSGVEVIHLRKPDCTKEELITLLKTVKPSNLKKLVIHQHHDLIEKYNLKGIHFTEKYRNELSEIQIKGLATVLKRKGMTLSTSFHDFEDLYEKGKHFDYAFLSPVFESISKEGYQCKYSLEEFQKGLQSELVKTKVIALGGITNDNIEKLENIGFHGFATGNYRNV